MQPKTDLIKMKEASRISSLSYIIPNPTHLSSLVRRKKKKTHNQHYKQLSITETTSTIFIFNATAKMGIPKKLIICLFLATTMAIQTTTALMPYTRTSLWDLMLPPDDPFRILEQAPLSSPKSIETLALVRCDWKETPTSHVITLDVPGLTKEDIKIEVEENRVLRIGGERKEEKEIEGERWHRFERISGKFWRQFRLPENADLEGVKAHLENGVLRIEVPKVAAEEKKRKVIDIAEERRDGGEDIKAMKKDEM